jgi:hypothetical protein
MNIKVKRKVGALFTPKAICENYFNHFRELVLMNFSIFILNSRDEICTAVSKS